jgi:2,4-dienoyl-CoA reductase-like NADH-dependent reductase (Old Yellow Enzyme family)/thioredoxin reductase
VVSSPDTEADVSAALQPFTLNGVELRNRIVRTSQGTGLSVRGMVTDDLIAWNVARARGGVSLLFADMGEVHWSSPGMINNTTDAVVEGLLRLTAAVHAEGAKVFQQLLHGGPTNIPHDGTAPWGASPIADPGLAMVCRPMTRRMIAEVLAGFGASAKRAIAGGIDGLEVHGGHGYLFSAFLSPATNHRTDEYGGPLENRSRLLLEALAAVREAVGPAVPVGVRLSADGPDDQTTVGDLIQLVGLLEASGLIDYVDLSHGSHFRRDLLMGATHEPHGYQLPATGQIARMTSLPTIVTGRIMTLAEAAEVIAAGTADLVAMVRATIAEPELITKSLAGDHDDIKPCIGCNQGCVGGLNLRARSTCVVNVGAGRELILGDHNVRRMEAPSRVVVVGGGPAGLEAARVGALAGHQVVLYEAADELGGQLRIARRSPMRAEIAKLIPYYERQLAKHGVDVRLGHEIGLNELRAVPADLVVLATGAVPRLDGYQTWHPAGPPLGWETIAACTGWDALLGAELGRTVLVIDEIGHYEAIDVVEALVDRGHHVHHVTRLMALSSNLEMRWDMVGAVHMARLLRGNFYTHPRSIVLEVGEDYAVIAPVDGMHRSTKLQIDSVVAMNGHVPTGDLPELAPDVIERLQIVGDAAGPRSLEAAIAEGQMAIRSLEPGWIKPAGLRFGQTGSAI